MTVLHCSSPECKKPFYGFAGEPRKAYCEEHYSQAKGQVRPRRQRVSGKKGEHRHERGTTTRVSALISTEAFMKFKAQAESKGVSLHSCIVDALEHVARLL